MEKFFTAILITISLVILHNMTTAKTTETISSEIVLSEVSF